MSSSAVDFIDRDKEEVKMVLIKPIVIKFPKRNPSIASLKRTIVYITPDKTTCTECPCFKDEAPYQKKPKLRPCLQSPLTLYELSAAVVDSLFLPPALKWSVQNVAKWMDKIVGYPQYKVCILVNKIDGMRLLMLEDISHSPKIGITDFEHVKIISSLVHKLYSTEFIKFARSIGLPHRLPLTYCTWFNARTGPSWGIHQNWSNTDLLRWMKIIGPEPRRLDHWDLVWYQKPDFPKTMFARVGPHCKTEKIPIYRDRIEYCNEYQTPRMFRMWKHLPEENQLIFMEHLPGDPLRKDPIVVYPDTLKGIKKKPGKVKESRLMPKKIDPTGLTGKDLLLARRAMPKKKFIMTGTPAKKK